MLRAALQSGIFLSFAAQAQVSVLRTAESSENRRCGGSDEGLLYGPVEQHRGQRKGEGHGLAGAAFSRMIGLWWADLMTALREHTAARGGTGPGTP